MGGGRSLVEKFQGGERGVSINSTLAARASVWELGGTEEQCRIYRYCVDGAFMVASLRTRATALWNLCTGGGAAWKNI